MKMMTTDLNIVARESQTHYAKCLKMPQWRLKRMQIIKRDGGQCRSCGTKHNLQVHHRQYHTLVKTGERKLPWQYDNKYLVTLCATCHLNGHQKYHIPVFSI